MRIAAALLVLAATGSVVVEGGAGRYALAPPAGWRAEKAPDGGARLRGPGPDEDTLRAEPALARGEKPVEELLRALVRKTGGGELGRPPRISSDRGIEIALAPVFQAAEWRVYAVVADARTAAGLCAVTRDKTRLRGLGALVSEVAGSVRFLSAAAGKK